MSTYAIIQLGGQQHLVSTGEVITTNKLENQAGDKIVCSDVLLVRNNDQTQVGAPLVKGAKVELEVLAQTKGDKIRVTTYKAKSRYRKVKGFRAALTQLKVVSINAA